MFKSIKNTAFKFRRRLRNNRRGMSLLVTTVVFIPAFMIISTQLTQLHLNVIWNTANHRNEMLARHLAESAETAAVVSAERGPRGMNMENRPEIMDFLKRLAADAGIANCADIDPVAEDDQPCIGFKVVGRTENAAQVQLLGTRYYAVPSAHIENGARRGTGSASGKCSALAGDANYEMNSADDPCYWDVLKFGDTVDIPLYYEEDVNENGVIDPSEMHVLCSPESLCAPDDFILRIRTRCKDVDGVEVADCEPHERIELYPPVVPHQNSDAKNRPFRHPEFEQDPVLVQWMINDMQGGGTLIARDVTNKDETNNEMRPPLEANKNEEKDNTEISGGRINAANNEPGIALNNFIMFKGDYKGERVTTDNQFYFIQDFIRDSREPKLRLSFVTRALRLLENENENMDILNNAQLNNNQRYVPELEYQVLTKNKPVADSKAYIIGWSKIGALGNNYGRTFRKALKYPAFLGGFALGNL